MSTEPDNDELPVTGHADIDRALAEVDLSGPVDGHAAVFQRALDALHAALASGGSVRP